MFKVCIYSYNNNAALVGTNLLKRGNWEQVERTEENTENIFATCQFIWKPTNLISSEYNKLDNAVRSRHREFTQVLNHFEFLNGLCTKTGLIRSLRRYYQLTKESKQIKYNVYETTPTTFLASANPTEYEYSLFVARYQEIAKQDFSREALPQKHCSQNIWLVKPADQNQGRGIEIFKNLADIEKFLTSKAAQSFWVIQKYIERPLLYHGRKFDIRMWAIITAKNEVFLYRKGYIRTSSEAYDLKNGNNYVHLTNNCLQKFNSNYGQHEEGNTLPLESLDEYLAQTYPEIKPTVEGHIMPRIKDLVIDTFLSVKKELNPLNRKNVFEFLGYDFMVDEDLRTWLIEVNTNPYIGVPTEYIGGLLDKMLDDMFKIVLDPLFPPKDVDTTRPNDFELLYCEQGSLFNSKPMNKRTPFKRNVYPAQELTPPDVIKKMAVIEKEVQAQTQAQQAKPKEVKVVKLPKEKKIEKEKDDEKGKQKEDSEESEEKEEGKTESNVKSKPKEKNSQKSEREVKEVRPIEKVVVKAEKIIRDRNPVKSQNEERVEPEKKIVKKDIETKPRVKDLSLKKEKAITNVEKAIPREGNLSPIPKIEPKKNKKKDKEKIVKEEETNLHENEQKGPEENATQEVGEDKEKEKNKLPAINAPKKDLKSIKSPSKEKTVNQHKRFVSHDVRVQEEISIENNSFLSELQNERDYILEQTPDTPAAEQFVPMRDPYEKDKGRVKELLQKIDDLHRDLHLASVYKTNYNSASFTKKMTEVIECMGECDLLTEKQTQTSAQVLTLIAQSEANWVLTQQHIVDILTKMLNSASVRHGMKCHIIDIFYMLAKTPELRISLLDTTLVSELAKICLILLTRQQMTEKGLPILLVITHCLTTLGKVFNRRAFTAEGFASLQPHRLSFISQGGILALWLLILKGGDPKLRSFVYKSFLDHVLLEDLEQQFVLLKGLKEEPKVEAKRANIHSEPIREEISLMKKYATLTSTPANISSKSMAQEFRSPGTILDKVLEDKKAFFSGNNTRNNLNNSNEEPDSLNLFQKFADVFTQEDLMIELEGYIQLRRDGIFGYDDEEREKRKLLAQMASILKKDEEKIPPTSEEENANSNAKALIERLEKKAGSNLQKFQLEVNCRQKEISDMLKEKEDKKRQVRSLLQQKAETMRVRNKLELKRKELEKLAYKEDKSDQLQVPQLGSFEINTQKASCSPIRNSIEINQRYEEEPSMIKQANDSVSEIAIRPRVRKTVRGLETHSLQLKALDKAFLRNDAVAGSIDAKGQKLKVLRMMEAENPLVETSLPLILMPGQSARTPVNEFLKSPASLKAKKILANLVDGQSLPKNRSVPNESEEYSTVENSKLEKLNDTSKQMISKIAGLQPSSPRPTMGESPKKNVSKTFLVFPESKLQESPEPTDNVAKSPRRFLIPYQTDNSFQKKKRVL